MTAGQRATERTGRAADRCANQWGTPGHGRNRGTASGADQAARQGAVARW